MPFDACILQLDGYRYAKCGSLHERQLKRQVMAGPKVFPISDNVSVVIQGASVQHFRFF